MDEKTRREIGETVMEILRNSDSGEMTEFKVRSAASKLLKIDLYGYEQKMFIRGIVEEFLLSSSEEIGGGGDGDANSDHPVQEGEDRDKVDELGNRLICKLSSKRNVVLNEFKGKAYVQIRDYYQKDGKELPTSSGVALTSDQWLAFKQSIPAIEEAIKTMQSNVRSEGGGEENRAVFNSGEATKNRDISISAEVTKEKDVSISAEATKNGDISSSAVATKKRFVPNLAKATKNGDISSSAEATKKRELSNSAEATKRTYTPNSAKATKNGDICSSSEATKNWGVSNSVEATKKRKLSRCAPNSAKATKNGDISTSVEATKKLDLSNSAEATKKRDVSNSAEASKNGSASNSDRGEEAVAHQFVPIRTTRFDGKNYYSWAAKMEFFLNQLNIAYVLTEPPPFVPVSTEGYKESFDAKAAKHRWASDDRLCCHCILNALSDPLYNKFSNKPYSARELWEELRLVYLYEEHGTRRSHVRKYIEFQIHDGKPVYEQVQEFDRIADDIVASGMGIDENFHVSAIISKLPASWKDVANKLMREEILPFWMLIDRLKLEQDSRDGEKQGEHSRFAGFRSAGPGQRAGDSRKPGLSWKSPEPETHRKSLPCSNCGRRGHVAEVCWNRKGNTASRSSPSASDVMVE